MMTIVEHNKEHKYPTFVWAKSIQVSVEGEEIEISGANAILEEDRFAAPDPLRAYRQAIARYAGAKRQGKNSPHVEFANANCIQKQVTFLSRYGPVFVDSIRTEVRPIKSEGPFDFGLSETVMVARQKVAELHKEHLVYQSAWILISELQARKEPDGKTIRRCISTIVNNVSDWPRQWERERRLRATDMASANCLWSALEPSWIFTEKNLEHLEFWMWGAEREPSGDPLRDTFMGLSPVHCGHLVICELVNAFAPLVYPWGDSPVEAPHWEIIGGIRPLLYFMLRREYLRAGGIAICRNIDCRQIFEIERSGQEFCGQECSRLQRQREYWSIRGKKMRKRRIKQRERKSGGTEARNGRKEK